MNHRKSTGVGDRVLLALCVVIFVAALWLSASRCYGQRGAPVASAEWWTWSEPAAHHQAAVALRTSNGQGGSGVYVEAGGVKGVLTAEHVLRGAQRIEALWFDGQKSQATGYSRDKYGHDLAWVRVERSDVTPLPISARPVSQGDRLEVLGFGGPGSVLRHYYVRYGGETYQRSDSARPGPTSGDSGGAILTVNPPAVVSVVTHGDQTRATHQGWPVFGELIFPRPRFVADFATRTAEYVQCLPGQCPPSPGGGMAPLYPPQPSPGGGSNPFPRRPLAEVAKGLSRAREASLRNRLDRVETRQRLLERWTN